MGAKVHKNNDICKKGRDFFAIRDDNLLFCSGGGVAECHSGERKEERVRREIDQAWSIYGGSVEPMPEYNSGEMNEDKRNERR